MKSLVLLLPALAAASSPAFSILPTANSTIKDACDQIKGAVSKSSQVFYPLSGGYSNDIEHYFTSSIQRSVCSVEVGSTADTAAVMKIIAATKVPFGIKSGGHASNQGWSSTTGVQIALSRMNEVVLAKDNSSVLVGLGNTWTDVYTALDGTGYNVVGGRVDGPGTGGFTLGGGYSWLTNQYGLTCDTTISYTLVLPNGTVTTVDSSTPDLLFALRGGLNRFGIVTEIVYKAVPQPPLIYAGIQVFPESAYPALINATNQFDDLNRDPLAQVILTFDCTPSSCNAILLSYYGGPNRPAAFDPYNGIKPTLSLLKTQSFLSFAKSAPSFISAGKRGAYHGFSTTALTTPFLAACANESMYYSQLDPSDPGVFVSYDTEPFENNYGRFATDSAFPHAKSPRPLNLYFGWKDKTKDTFWQTKMKESVAYLTSVAKKEGVFDASLSTYPNYALADTPVETLYGAKNVKRLRAIRRKIDPQGIMNLAGGFPI